MTDDKVLHDQELGKRATYRFEQDPKVNKPAYIINDETNEVSGSITPTTPKALTNLKRAVRNNRLNLAVSKDSSVRFASSVPTGSLTNGSSLTVTKGSSVSNVTLDHSSIICSHGQIVDSTFKDTNYYHKEPATYSPLHLFETYIFKSNFDHVHLIENNYINTSDIKYAALNRAQVEHSSIKGGNFYNSKLDHDNMWLLPDSIISSSELKGTRIEDRSLTLKDYQEKANDLATSLKEMYNVEPFDIDPYNTMIDDSKLNNVQILSNKHTGTTLDGSTLKNTFVKEWIIADQSNLIAEKRDKPLLIGRVSLSHNDLQFRNSAVCFNLDEYSSTAAAEGLEVPKGTSYDDTNIGTYAHAIQIMSNHPDVKKLTELEQGHYALNNGDEAFSNLTNILQDDGGQHLAINHTAQKATTQSKQHSDALDEPEL